jgi:hypothetical protein
MNTTDELKARFERTREGIHSDRNHANARKWKREAGRKAPDGPFNLFLGMSYFSRALGVDLREYYADPIVYLRTNLRLSLMKFEKFMDDVPLTTTIPWNPGVTMEPSLFGVKAVYQSDKEAWESHDAYLIGDYSDLASMRPPDFLENNAMRYIHSMYERLSELVGALAPDFSVSFPRWRRSPFGNACSLRGMERLCLDFYDDPDFVHELMSFVTRSRIQWEDASSAFLGETCGYILANDEVNCPTVSPAIYTEFILPYEKQLLSYYGSLDYFHSCGDLTPLIPHIKTMDPAMFQVSPWTNLEAACKAFAGTRTVLDVWANTSDDVMNASGEHARQIMARRTATCREADIAGFQFNSGNIQQVAQTPQADDDKILQWADACRTAQER